jgi:putative membrane protein
MMQLHSRTLATALAVAFTAASVAHGQTPRAQDRTATPAAQQDIEFAQKAAASGRKEVEHGRMAAAKASNAQLKAFANTLVKDHTAANQQLMAIAKRKNIPLADADSGDATRPSAGGSADQRTSATKSGGKPAAVSGTTGTTGASGGVPTTGEAIDRQRRGGAATHQTEPWMSATGAAFDRGFIESQVKAHQEAISLFETQASAGSDADLKAFAQKQLPGLRNHLKQAQDLQAKLATSTSLR